MSTWMENAREGVLVICPSERLARELRVQYNQAERDRGEAVWSFPAISAFRNWVIREWEGCLPERQLLHPAQELALHLYVLEATGRAEGVLSPMSLARQMRDTDRLVANYGIDLPTAELIHGDAYADFVTHRHEFARRLEDKGWITAERVVDDLLAHLADGAWQPPTRVLFFGFQALTPQQQAFVDVLAEYGCDVEVDLADSAGASVEVRRLCYHDIEQETQGVARQVAESLQAGGDEVSVGIFVPSIQTWRTPLERALTRHLSPYRMAPGSGSEPPCWSYARGELLSAHPAVSASMDLLALRLHGNDMQLVSRVLLSRCLWSDEDRGLRARVEMALREGGGARQSLRRIQGIARRIDASARFVARMEELIGFLEASSSRALASSWCTAFERQLQLAGWVLLFDATSTQYQVLEAWRECLQRLMAMDGQLGEISQGRASAWLHEILANRDFSPRSSVVEPVRILEYADASAAGFTHAFVLGLTADTLPTPVAHNPFLPSEWLADAGAPCATPEAELAEAERLVACMSSSGSSVTFTTSSYGERGALQMPASPAGPWDGGCEPVESDPMLDGGSADPVTEMPDSDPVPPVSDEEAEGVRGGVSILGTFAESPYAAFLRSRLGVREMPSPGVPLDARVQGTFVHKVLERVWGELRNSERLRSIRADQRSDVVMDSIEQAANEDGLLLDSVFGPGLCRLERKRVTALVTEWLDMEASRAWDFEVILREKRVEGAVGRLPVRLQLDRVDRIETPSGDRFVCIDYKTGARVDASGWKPDKLTQPQLPLYASTDALSRLGLARCDGIAFGHVAAGHSAFTLWSSVADRLVARERDGEIGDGIGHWDSLLTQWRDRLDSYADAFMAGEAWVDPGIFTGWHSFNDLLPLMREREVIG